ncbi:membrane bound O-acyl transferase, MBOAT family [Sulfurimonas gotlandica GD1]|uniref:Membrane bound O-acyl transferase, MBOAT family n=1 Tax=Sulfurimonas gotlandica (strain DSM 19862 / JCM 16533 / GD1) TaxID=929558 RepID=B6BIX3_SULGG|nr:MBOAT family O-acyltransferase [Sulfurimonas gotlandica]EDZ62969.1 membrane bOund o-acyl transferase, mboat family protein [Sulfurimonas gotlandica GD1]EHP30484.1 membrane bound O-acyl transferase, MBOAT family [Sulfurimonas gotlandica GD1]
MLFNSYEFIFLFLPLSFFIYFYLLNKRLITGAKGFLVFASLFFYSWWNIAYLPLILSSMLFNYVIGNSLNENFKKVKISKKALLTFGVVANLSLLGYFKYSDFFINNFNIAFNSQINLLHLALPLAISFFTFQQIAYLVDSYRRETAEYDFLNYALFVTFFPQLIAGPIVHHAEMMPQFASRWNLAKNYKNIAAGIFIFSIGLFKKVGIADFFSVYVNNYYLDTASLHILEAWAASLTYTLQLYFDFSGYTDMAIGAALLFNIKLPINFNSPYKARNIQDFWRRWHITLSRFLRDYIYIPLGGNRKGNFITYNNILATFILGGIWHGAGWTFVFWGFLHGIALVVHRIYSNLNFHMPKIIAWFITFNFINFTWVFFRAPTFEDALNIVSKMFSFSEFKPDYLDDNIYSYIILGIILTIAFKNSVQLLENFKMNKKTAWFISILFVYSILSLNKASEFLYFNF